MSPMTFMTRECVAARVSALEQSSDDVRYVDDADGGLIVFATDEQGVALGRRHPRQGQFVNPTASLGASGQTVQVRNPTAPGLLCTIKTSRRALGCRRVWVVPESGLE